ncbi:MAG: arginase family protein [Nanoarchaeota archaeon]
MERQIGILGAPSILGLRPTGVEEMPRALRQKNLAARLGSTDYGDVESLGYERVRDGFTGALNSRSVREYSIRLAGRVDSMLVDNVFPLVLGGDCSIVLGNLLALRRRGRYGLAYVDGHSDFYLPENSKTGEVAEMTLAVAVGLGPGILSTFDGSKPLVREEDVALFGYRDQDESIREGCRNVRESVSTSSLNYLKRKGIVTEANRVVERFSSSDLNGFWLHLDADVLNPEIMPAVDYILPDGFNYNELRETLRTFLSSPKCVGMDVTIFNPRMDPSGEIAGEFSDCIVEGFENK